ncbi:MAG: proteasome accessory factor PafA2 family protein [Pirellulaceae bacterium]
MNAPRAEIFDRLIGLETEYAPRFSPLDPTTETPLSYSLYESLAVELGRRLPTAPARHFKEGRFLATGGALWFESVDAVNGLMEGATPECRSPRQLLTWQRGQDRLLSEAAIASRHDGRFTLIKNDRDSRGAVYGAQENYEAVVARGVWLFLWRAGLVAIFPLVLLYRVSLLLLYLAMSGYFLAAGLLCVTASVLLRRGDALSQVLLGRHMLDEGEPWVFPRWLSVVISIVERANLAPLAVSMYVLARLTAFRQLRRGLLPLLVSRAVVCGAGMVDEQDRFHLADKASGINCLVGFGGFLRDHPLFSFGHFLKAMFGEGGFTLRGYFELFRRRQRLQIALGDSNMCQRAEYLRIATTLLVIDAIEAGHLRRPPRVVRALRTLHRVASDASLNCEIRLSDGGRPTALEVQRYYLNACRRFLQTQPQAPDEAWETLHLWEDTLDQLEEAPQTLLGAVDWVTKLFLLGEAGVDAAWEQRKKIDLRYHELSPEGYHRRLADAGQVELLLDEEEIERATRIPPSDSPASTRGRYIREFAGGLAPIRASWSTIYLRRGRATQRIRLTDARRDRQARSAQLPERREAEQDDAPDDHFDGPFFW